MNETTPSARRGIYKTLQTAVEIFR